MFYCTDELKAQTYFLCACNSTMLCYRFVLRSLCIVLGIVVKQENTALRDENLKVLVANHVSPCDHIAVHLACGSITVSAFAHSVCSLKYQNGMLLKG